jgi:hypothetical protein
MIEYTDLHELDDVYLICKARGRHKMDINPSPGTVDSWRAQAASYVIPWRCERCGRECYEFLDSVGQRVGAPYYRNPVDYPHTHRLNGDDIRAEMISRSLLIRRVVDGEIIDNGKKSRRK